MIDKPNLVLPLATSYNERGVAGYTHAVTNSEDQRKVNCMYEAVKNPMTGKGTLALSKRHGIEISGSAFMTATAGPNLIVQGIVSSSDDPVVFHANSSISAVYVSGPGIASLETVGAAAGLGRPIFVDKARIGSLASFDEYIVLQISPGTPVSGTHRVFYSADPTYNSWTEISDGDFTGISHRGKMEHLDGYAFILSEDNLILNSDLNSLQSWTATSFFAKQIKQDSAVGLARFKNQLLAFGDNTVEGFYNAGGTTGSPLGRLAHLHQEIGLVPTNYGFGGGSHYYAILGERLYFVGRKSGSVGLYAYNGQGFEKVSSTYIDKIIHEKATSAFKSNSLYSVYPFGFRGQTAVAIGLTSPDTATQVWLMYFPDWKEWFEWNSTVYTPINNGNYFIGCAGNGSKIYHFNDTTPDNWQDDGTSYAWSTQFRLPSNGGSRNTMPMYGVDADTDTSTNDLTVEVSDNDCQSFYTLGTIDQTKERKLGFRGGSFTRRHIRLGNTNARPSRIHKFLARING